MSLHSPREYYVRRTHSAVVEGDEVHRSPLRAGRRPVPVTTHENKLEFG